MPNRSELLALERRHHWPPWTASERHERGELLVVDRAEGPFLYDVDGRRFFDANASWWACTLGHGHPRLRAAIHRQVDQLVHVAAGGITHAPLAELARDLTAAAPAGLSRVHFSDDGSTAVEAAVKAAFQYWQQNGRPTRHRFVALNAAYHGDTLGAASLASMEEFHATFHPLMFEVLRPPPPEQGGFEASVEALERMLDARPDEIAGVIVEPLIQGASGMRMFSPALLRRIAEATRRIDTFLIADEVFTGYGRTGAMWASELAGVTPDLMCVAKGFTAGTLPMAATLATDRVYDGFRGGPERALMHGHTFCGNPLGAAVAREVLAIYRDEEILSQVAANAPLIEAAFARLRELPGVRRTRSLGMVGAADLGDEGYRGQLGWRIFKAALQRGAFLRPLGDTVYVTPPLNIPREFLSELLEILYESVREGLSV